MRRSLRFAALVCAAAGVSTAPGDAFTWTGALNRYWNLPRNWSCGSAGDHYWPCQPEDVVEIPMRFDSDPAWRIGLVSVTILNAEVLWSTLLDSIGPETSLLTVTDRLRVYNYGEHDIELAIERARIFAGESGATRRSVVDVRTTGTARSRMSIGDGQEPYTFIVPDGYWDVPTNWDKGEIPGAGDWAIIPVGRQCRIENRDETIQNLELGGTLEVSNRTLTVDAAGSGCLTVDGLMNFRGTSTLRVPSDLAAYGDGVIRAVNGGTVTVEGYLEEPQPQYSAKLYIADPALTVRGSVYFYTNLKNDGLLLVDDEDEMRVGHVAPGPPFAQFEGNGVLRVTHPAGRMVFGRAQPGPDYNAMSRFEVHAGALHMTEHVSGWVCGAGRPSLILSGGLIDLDADFKIYGDLDFSGGKLAIAPGKEAVFSDH